MGIRVGSVCSELLISREKHAFLPHAHHAASVAKDDVEQGTSGCRVDSSGSPSALSWS